MDNISAIKKKFKESSVPTVLEYVFDIDISFNENIRPQSIRDCFRGQIRYSNCIRS